jgi:hypothetical protein
MGLIAQGEANVGVVQVIGRADGDIIDPTTPPGQFVHMTVEAFKFRKEIRVWKVTVDNSHAVVGIERRHEIIVRGLDGFHVSRRNITRGANEGEFLHTQALSSWGVSEEGIGQLGNIPGLSSL